MCGWLLYGQVKMVLNGAYKMYASIPMPSWIILFRVLELAIRCLFWCDYIMIDILEIKKVLVR